MNPQNISVCPASEPTLLNWILLSAAMTKRHTSVANPAPCCTTMLESQNLSKTRMYRYTATTAPRPRKTWSLWLLGWSLGSLRRILLNLSPRSFLRGSTAKGPSIHSNHHKFSNCDRPREPQDPKSPKKLKTNSSRFRGNSRNRSKSRSGPRTSEIRIRQKNLSDYRLSDTWLSGRFVWFICLIGCVCQTASCLIHVSDSRFQMPSFDPKMVSFYSGGESIHTLRFVPSCWSACIPSRSAVHSFEECRRAVPRYSSLISGPEASCWTADLAARPGIILWQVQRDTDLKVPTNIWLQFHFCLSKN